MLSCIVFQFLIASHLFREVLILNAYDIPVQSTEQLFAVIK